jgi:hypothetical protein
MPDPSSAALNDTLYQKIVKFINGLPKLASLEALRILPDSIVLGTAALSLISLTKGYGVLLLSMLELMLIQRIFASVVSGIAPVGAGHDAFHESCQPGLAFSNSMRISLLETVGKPSSFPSPVLFFMSGVLSYMISAVKNFSNEISSLGGDLNTRTTVSVVLSSFLLFSLLIFRYTYGCESFGTLFVSLILGIIAGLVIVEQNKLIFGRAGINVLNLPMIIKTGESGKSMYVCAPSLG